MKIGLVVTLLARARNSLVGKAVVVSVRRLPEMMSAQK